MEEDKATAHKFKIDEGKYEKIMAYARGENHRYNILLILNLISVGIISTFLHTGLSFNEILPYVISPGKTSQLLTFDQCERTKMNIDYQIDYSKSINNLVLEFGIFCNKLDISFLGSFLGLGSILGCVLAFLIGNKHGPKKAIRIFITAIIITLFLFLCNSVVHSLAVLYLLIAMYSISGMCLVIYKIIFITDMSTNYTLPYLLAFVTSSGILSLYMNLLMYWLIRDWIYVFIFFCLFTCVSTVILTNTLIESSRYLLMRGKFEEFKRSVISVGCISGRKQYLTEEEIYKIINVGLSNVNPSAESSETDNEVSRLTTENTYSENQHLSSVSSSFTGYFSYLNSHRVYLENFVLFMALELFLPTVYSSSISYITIHYPSFTVLYYIAGVIEAFIKILAACFMNLIGRKYTKSLFLSLVIVAFIMAKLFRDDEVIFMYMLYVTRVCVETASFVNVIHMLESFPTAIRFRTLAIFSFLSKIGMIVFPMMIHNSTQNISIMVAVYSVLSLVINALTKETMGSELKNE